MSIGSSVRQIFGPFERPISELYRRMFINLDAFVDQIHSWAPSSTNIFELGCGEGAIAERLVNRFPAAHTTGIDTSPRIGRMYRGQPGRVTFKQQTIKDFAAVNSEVFDLLLICDVMHHIPWELHEEILIDAAKVLKPGAYLVLKDWERKSTPIHFLAYFSDRYITGDHICYKTAEELRKLIEAVFGTNRIKAETRIGPWTNNIAFLVQV